MFPLRDYEPSGIVPYVSYGLLGANVLVFFYQLALGQQPSDVRSGAHLFSANDVFIFTHGFVPCKLFARCLPGTFLDTPIPLWMTLFTSMFMHGGLMHVGGNMLYLWIFGDNVEAAFGHIKFLAFYLLSGVGAALAQALAAPDSPAPMIGASGAISGVLAAYVFMFPRARVLTLLFFLFFVRLVRLPAAIILGVWFAVQLFSAFGSLGGGGSGVAFMAHVGGFAAGALIFKWFRKPVPVLPASF